MLLVNDSIGLVCGSVSNFTFERTNPNRYVRGKRIKTPEISNLLIILKNKKKH